MLLFTNLVREIVCFFFRISCGAMETCRGGESETQIARWQLMEIDDTDRWRDRDMERLRDRQRKPPRD